MNDNNKTSNRRPEGMGRLGLLAGGLLLTATAALAESDPGSGGSLSGLQWAMIAAGLLAVAGVGVAALVLWGRKQDQIGEMALFGMRYLLDFDRVPEGCDAAKELGRSGDPEAFLVLLDVLQDEAAPEPVRQAAGEALENMSHRSRKLKDVIQKAKSASEEGEHNELIRILTEDFERDGARYVQSAYLIGRAYLRLDHVADAKEWFRVAETRNRKAALYGGRIRTLIDKSNRRLFAIGDERFAAAEYQIARERYAAASHGLSADESRRNSAFLRLACAYCMLGDYRDAEQALLQALRHGQNTDPTLALSQMLQQLLDRQSPPSEERHHQLTTKIRDQAQAIIRRLADLGGSDG